MNSNGKNSTENDVVIVSGLPRSGTSMMMKMLQAAGFDLLSDDLRKEDKFNPNGYYEYGLVRRLKSGGNAWLNRATGRVVKIVSPLLPYINPDLNYKVIFMQRDMKETVQSQARMLLGFQTWADPNQERGLEETFRRHLADVDAWMRQQPNLDYLNVNYNQLLVDPSGVFTDLAEFLHRPIAADDLAGLINPNLYRNRREDGGDQVKAGD